MNTRPRSGFKSRCAVLLLASLLLGGVAFAQSPMVLSKSRYRDGEQTLGAFKAVSDITRDSIGKLNVDGETVSLATVIDNDGLAIAKASELKPGRLTCWLASGAHVDASVLATDEEHDLALVKIEAEGLKPVRWSSVPVTLGQWAITPGVAELPHAAGIVSASSRRIRPPRAFVGIQFEFSSESAVVREVMRGLGAQKAGLKPGDLITAVDGVPITNRLQMIEMLREYREGQSPKLRYRRGESETEVAVMMKVPTPEQLGPGFSTGRSSRLDGRVSTRVEGFESVIQHDTVLAPWLCGGPLVDLDGKVIGINIARAGRVATYALPVSVVQRTISDLVNRVKTSSSTKAREG